MKLSGIIKFDIEFVNKKLASRKLSFNRPEELTKAVINFTNDNTELTLNTIKALKGEGKRRIRLNPLNDFVRFLFEDHSIDLYQALKSKKITSENIQFELLGQDFKRIYALLETMNFKTEDIILEFTVHHPNNLPKISYNAIQLNTITSQYINHFKENIIIDELETEIDTLCFRRDLEEELNYHVLSKLDKNSAKLILIEGQTGVGKTFLLYNLFNSTSTRFFKTFFLYKDFDSIKLQYLIDYKLTKPKLLFLDSLDKLLLETNNATDCLLNINTALNYGISIVATSRYNIDFNLPENLICRYRLNLLNDNEFNQAIDKFSLIYKNIFHQDVASIDKLHNCFLRNPIFLKIFMELNSVGKIPLDQFTTDQILNVYWKEKVVKTDEHIDSKEFQNWLISIAHYMSLKGVKYIFKNILNDFFTNNAQMKLYMTKALCKGILTKVDKYRYGFSHDSLLDYINKKSLT